MASTLWLLDRSRYADGVGFCQRARLLNYHVGPHGFGIARKGTKVPLMTGIGMHEGAAPILAWCRDNDALIVDALKAPLQEGEQLLPVPRAIVRQAVDAAVRAYWRTVGERGFGYLKDDENVKQVTTEQTHLVEGLIWAWCLEVLPEILMRGRILEVEEDDTYVFACTCGLGVGVLTKADHEARDCTGMGLMCKPDFLVESRTTGELEYHEFKTTGMDSPSFKDKWEVMIQMFAATLDAERRHNKHVQSIYVHGMIKGKFEGMYNPDTGKRDGARFQNSPMCYGYRKPANPPLEQEEWAFSYEYWDEYEQKTRRLGRKFQRTPIWELPSHLIPAGMSVSEYWVQTMPSAVRRKQFVLLGPFSRQSQMVDHFLTEAEANEIRVQQGLWELYDIGVRILEEAQLDATEPNWWGTVWPHQAFQSAMDRLFPRSYECRRYGERHKCQFENICLYREGWADPIASGRYIMRRPHHEPELQQLRERGLIAPAVGLFDEEEREL